MKRAFTLIFILVYAFVRPLFAQEAMLKGTLVTNSGGQPLSDISISIPRLKISTTTDTVGAFYFYGMYHGQFTLIITDGYVYTDSVKVNIDTAFVDLGVVKINYIPSNVTSISTQTPEYRLSENDASFFENGTEGQSISGLLNASDDPYLSAAASNFGNFRYQMRGYNRDQLTVYLNGLQMNDIETGIAFWEQWGGLNDMFRNQNTEFGLQAAEVGVGGLAGITSFEATAAAQSKQMRFSYAFTNRSYRNRAMLSYASGVMPKGWAFAFSGSRRWAKEAYVPGTFYESYGYYLGISKRLKASSMLHFTAIGASVRKGKATAATLEAMELSGSHFYNANWGYQNGEKRNAGISHNFQPLFTLNYDYVPDNRTRLELAAAYQFGFNGNSALDWYNAQDPRPDYYRNMPSYYETDSAILNIAAANEVRNKWMTDEAVRQINWNRLYETNNANIQTVSGETGKRSLYIVGESLNEIRKFSLSGTFNKVLNEYISFSGGAFFASQLTERYKRISDLLGGDFYVNLNQYAERTYIGNSIFIQNDLNNPDGIIKEGGKYGYDYKIKFMKSFIWGQMMFDYKKVDFFGAARLGVDAFIREGLFKNGLFAEDSYGSSANHRFFNYQVKGGATYKIDGRNYLFVNAAIITVPPLFNNTFISPATRNLALERPRMEQIKSIEGGYLLRASGFSGKLAAFVSEINDATRVRRFYHEDYLAFVNYLMRNLNVRHIGAELSIQTKITSSLSATAVASWKQVFYTSDAAISIYRDNDTTAFVPQSVSYLKNTFVAVGPQTACMLGLDYRMPGYWHVGANFNYLARNYVDINPIRYTAEVLETIPKGSSRWHAIVDQEKLPPAFTVDLSVGKSFLLSKAVKRSPHGTYLLINLTITNLLNNKDIQAGGYEQSRFDMATFNPDKFPSKYYYSYGAGYFLNLSLKF